MGRTLIAFFSILLAFILTFSFGLHTFDHTHTHPGGDHTEGVVSLGEYTHGTEKKSFLLVVFSVVIASLYITSQFGRYLLVLSLLRICYKRMCRDRARFCYFDYILELFASGILHPKLYS